MRTIEFLQHVDTVQADASVLRQLKGIHHPAPLGVEWVDVDWPKAQKARSLRRLEPSRLLTINEGLTAKYAADVA